MIVYPAEYFVPDPVFFGHDRTGSVGIECAEFSVKYPPVVLVLQFVFIGSIGFYIGVTGRLLNPVYVLNDRAEHVEGDYAAHADKVES